MPLQPWAPLALLLIFSLPAATTSDRFAEIAHRAEAARNSDHLTEALRLYREAVRLRPTWSEGWRSLGSIYYDQDRFAEAAEAFRRYIATGTNVGPAYAFLGLCEYETRDYDRATEHLGYWVKKGSPGTAQLADVATVRWAELLTRNGRFFESLYLLDKKVATKYGPDSALVEAMGLAWMHLQSTPEDCPPERREMVWLAGSAGAWMSAKKFDRAHEYLDQLGAYYGQQPEVHFLRGFVYEEEKKGTEAIAEYRQELKFSPRHATAMAKLAVLDVQFGDLDEARQVASQGVLLGPDNAQAHYALGRVLVADEKWPEAAQELETAKKLAPNSDRVHFYLAMVYRKLGRPDDAMRETAVYKQLMEEEETSRIANEKSVQPPRRVK